MYLITIHVPIYLRGSERLLATPWKRSLLLLRDSFGGRYGKLSIVAPYVDVASGPTDQALDSVATADELALFPTFARDTRARDFWTRHVHTWRREVARHVRDADVVHAGFCDVYRPMTFIGFLLGYHARKPTVFVQDTDIVLQMSELARDAGVRQRAVASAYCSAYERGVRYGVARASLSLLKGGTVLERYRPYARNAQTFHDTSFLRHEIIPQARLDQRIHELVQSARPMRLVYCGRLDARKGLSESIRAIAEARSRGTRLAFDIIGDGDERAALQEMVDRLGLRDAVRFLGIRPYGHELLNDLGAYDALLFTPTAEDTPRMIFDGYAAGLPLVAYAIQYVLEREREDRAAVSAGRNVHAMAELLHALDRDRQRLAELARHARRAALNHTAENWYHRRADWTDEAVARHRAERGG